MGAAYTQPEPCIALVRHGRSGHIHTGWIDIHGYRAWREAYEAAGILEKERTPAYLEQLAARAGLVLSSDTARTVASARLLAPADKIVVSPLLRELDLESPALGGLRLPLAAWALAISGRVLLRTLLREYPSAAEIARINDGLGGRACSKTLPANRGHSWIVQGATIQTVAAERLAGRTGTALAPALERLVLQAWY